MNVEEESWSTDVKDGDSDVIFGNNSVTGGTLPMTAHGSMSFAGPCVQRHVDNGPRLTFPPPPSTFLAPPPYPHHLCSPPYVTSFQLPPLYPVRPRPLTSMTQFQLASFDGGDWFQPSGRVRGAGFVGVVDSGRLVGGEVTSPWRPGEVDAARARWPNVDQVQESLKSTADCRDEVDEDVDELKTTDNEHIDVDTIDDSTSLSATAAAECLNAPSFGMM